MERVWWLKRKYARRKAGVARGLCEVWAGGGVEGTDVVVVADEKVGYVASLEEEGGRVFGEVLELETRYLLIHSFAATIDGWED